MAAIAYSSPNRPSPSRSAHPANVGQRSARPQLRVIEGGLTTGAVSRPSQRSVRAALFAVATLAAVIVAPAAAAAIGSTVSAMTSSPAPAVAPVATNAAHLYTVRPGDTLWSIATQVAGNRDVRQVVDQLTRVAGGTTLKAGTTLDLTSVAP
jgi:Tfp pilus assembly protein FimV